MPQVQLKEPQEKHVVLRKPLQNSSNQQNTQLDTQQNCLVCVPDKKKRMVKRRGRGKRKVVPLERLEPVESDTNVVGSVISSKGLMFPRRPGFGQAGIKCIVKANHFLAELPDKDLFHYDVLVCSRDGSIYSFDLGGGDLLWQYNVGYPITSSAYVDDNMQLISDTSSLSGRLICICSSPGSIYLLTVNLHAMTETVQLSKEIFDPVVQEFARIDLAGDIFSSPVMIGGRIFVGCRDDYVHCIGVEAKIAV